MSFWRTFGFHTISPIDTLLEKPDCTLQELYDEDELLQECKSQNRRLLDFLTEPIHLEQMVQYLVEEPPEGSDEKRALKYPYLSSEVLSSDLWQIVEAVYNHPSVLQMIYSFLNRDPPVNPLLANYSTKVAAALMQRKVPETLDFLKTKLPNIVSRLVVHLNSPGVMELLMKIATADEGTGVDVYGTVKWLCDENLVGLLVDRFVESNDPEVHENVAQALIDLITVTSGSASQANPNPDAPAAAANAAPAPITPPQGAAAASSAPAAAGAAAGAPAAISPIIIQLESRSVVSKLLDRIFQKGENGSALQNGLGILIELLNKRRAPAYDPATTQMPELFDIVSSRFADCQKILDGIVTNIDPNATLEEMSLTYGTLRPPLGLARQRVLDFVKAVVCCNSKPVFDAFLASPLLDTCTKLFFHYLWNTFLHQTVYEIVTVILSSSHVALKKHLLIDCRLIDLILEAEEANKQDIARTNMARGYIGHLTKISNLINNLAHPSDPDHTPDADLAALLDTKPQWKPYSEGPLDIRTKNEAQLLGGTRPVAAAALGEELDQAGGDAGGAGGLAGIMYRIGAIGSTFDQGEAEDPPEDGEVGENVFDPNEFDARAPFTTDEKPFGFDNFEDNSSGSSSDEDEDEDSDEANNTSGSTSGGNNTSGDASATTGSQELDDGEVLIHTGIGGTHSEGQALPEGEEQQQPQEQEQSQQQSEQPEPSASTEHSSESSGEDTLPAGEEAGSRVVSTPPETHEATTVTSPEEATQAVPTASSTVTTAPVSTPAPAQGTNAVVVEAPSSTTPTSITKAPEQQQSVVDSKVAEEFPAPPTEAVPSKQ